MNFLFLELDAADDTVKYTLERLNIRAQYFQCPAAATGLLNEEGATRGRTSLNTQYKRPPAPKIRPYHSAVNATTPI